MQQDSEGLNLVRAVDVLRRRLPLIALCVLVVAGAAFGFSKRATKKYTATGALSFNTNSISEQVAGLPTSAPTNSTALQAQEAQNVELVKNGNAVAKTADMLGLPADRVLASVSVSGQGESSIVDVSATTTSPALSAKMVNTYITQFVQEQQRASVQYYRSALAIVQKQLAALSPAQRIGADGLELQNRAQTLSLLSELKVGGPQVVSEASAPSSPSSPKTTRNTALGAFFGLVIAFVLVLLLERLNRRIREPEELEAIYRLPLLGTVPRSAALARLGRERSGRRTALPPEEAERFSLIRARLRFFNVDRQLRTIVIASAEPDDGKTLIARHLAEAAARLGSRVLLLETDLRHPTLAEQLGIQPGPGLADVLIGAVAMDQALASIQLDGPGAEGAGARAIDVLAAGAVLPPNPSELLESRAIDAVLERARLTYDLVVIDTPPLTAVSDAFPLLAKVDGIVLVGRVGRSHRHAAERLRQDLESSGAPLLGVVANGSDDGGPGVYAYTREGKQQATVAASNGAVPAEQLAPTARP